jgi:hypothetical protein
MWYQQLALQSPFSYLVYGIEDSHEIYTKISKSKFYEYLHEEDSLPIGSKLKVRSLTIRNHKNLPVPLNNKVRKYLDSPKLTVFNSPSLAFNSLVSLFEFAQKYDGWIETYQAFWNDYFLCNCQDPIKLTPQQRRVLKSYLSLGMAPNLYTINPELLPHLPKFGTESLDEKFFKERMSILDNNEWTFAAGTPISDHSPSPSGSSHPFSNTKSTERDTVEFPQSHFIGDPKSQWKKLLKDRISLFQNQINHKHFQVKKAQQLKQKKVSS